MSRVDRIMRGIAGLAVLAAAQGCGPVGSPPADLDRASLGTVGVYSVGAPPAASLGAPVGVPGQVAKGAAMGGTIGVLSGAGSGALASLACGPFAPVCAVVFGADGRRHGPDRRRRGRRRDARRARRADRRCGNDPGGAGSKDRRSRHPGRDAPARDGRRRVDCRRSRWGCLGAGGAARLQPLRPTGRRHGARGRRRPRHARRQGRQRPGAGSPDRRARKARQRRRRTRAAHLRSARLRIPQGEGLGMDVGGLDAPRSELDRGLAAIARRIDDGTFRMS